MTWERTGHLKVGARECQCGGCGLYFSSPWTFDMHRYTDDDGTRRCLTTRQMREKGMVKDGKGRWGMGAEGRGLGAVPGGQGE